MGHFLPSTPDERGEMLRDIGLHSPEELFATIPEELHTQAPIGPGLSEMEASALVSGMADKNTVFPAIFRGAGAYNHYIPAIVDSVTGKEEFLTAYTPYQAEISQGILQSIFEYQTMICELTGMQVANASHYDGASAAAEAAAMCRDRKRGRVLVSQAAPPMVIEAIRTYAWGTNATIEVVPLKEGRTDLEALAGLMGADVACVYVQQPNYFGLIEDAGAVARLAHASGAQCIMGVNPIAMAQIKTPGECGADIAVGEGQPLGLPLGFGGPYLGFMATTQAHMRKLPGRIVGETVDLEGRRAYVLTLQAREQHIRREKASSNICSNQALCAMRSAVYMAAMGPEGLKQVAGLCMSKAAYAAQQISAIPGFSLRYPGAFFHEFVTECPVAPEKIERELAGRGMLSGLPLDGGMLWCVTEMNTRQQIDALVSALREVASCN
nr:aminomethyl-transferring glycine dehydrogenase subunit GcvPA [bacterium]